MKDLLHKLFTYPSVAIIFQIGISSYLSCQSAFPTVLEDLELGLAEFILC
jgi:hypothetical protein